MPLAHEPLDDVAEVYRALVCGLEGYVRKNGFKQVVLLDYSLTQLKQAMQRMGKNQTYIYRNLKNL